MVHLSFKYEGQGAAIHNTHTLIKILWLFMKKWQVPLQKGEPCRANSRIGCSFK